MTTYLIVFLACSALLATACVIRRGQQMVMVQLCVIVLTVFAALRGYVGWDTYSYHQLFLYYSGEDLTDVVGMIEPSFLLLTKGIALVSDSSFLFIGLIAVIQGLLLWQLVSTSRRPAQFLLLYLAIFYLNFHFNALRAGTGILLLLLANRATDQRKFYLLGAAAVLTHYSALVAFIPMAISRQKSTPAKVVAAALIAFALALAFGYAIENESLSAKYLFYTELLASDTSTARNLSFILGLPLYLMLYLGVADRSNRVKVTALFLAWLVLRSLTVAFPIVARLESIANAVLLFSVIEYTVDWQRRQLRNVAVAGLTAMWLYGGLVALSQEEEIAAAADLDEFHASSPFIPYRFAWDEP